MYLLLYVVLSFVPVYMKLINSDLKTFPHRMPAVRCTTLEHTPVARPLPGYAVTSTTVHDVCPKPSFQ